MSAARRDVPLGEDWPWPTLDVHGLPHHDEEDEDTPPPGRWVRTDCEGLRTAVDAVGVVVWGGATHVDNEHRTFRLWGVGDRPVAAMTNWLGDRPAECIDLIYVGEEES